MLLPTLPTRPIHLRKHMDGNGGVSAVIFARPLLYTWLLFRWVSSTVMATLVLFMRDKRVDPFSLSHSFTFAQLILWRSYSKAKSMHTSSQSLRGSVVNLNKRCSCSLLVTTHARSIAFLLNYNKCVQCQPSSPMVRHTQMSTNHTLHTSAVCIVTTRKSFRTSGLWTLLC